MRMRTIKAGGAAGMALAAGLSLCLAGSASADTSARSGDVVGVGSDTIQNAADFLFDGAPGNVTGYNSLGNLNRVFNYFATGDANGRAIFDGTCGPVSATTGLGASCATTTDETPNSLAGSVILRAGTDPVTRPNGSGAGAVALIDDTPGDPTDFKGYDGLATGSINFARMSRLPSSTEEGDCPSTSACGGLHVYQAATDQLEIAADNTTNAPAGLDAADLIQIYECNDKTWNSLPGNTSGSTDTIDPLIPQTGSGTRNFFLADLQTANGGTAVTLGGCVRTVEEHDPTGIYGDPSPKDAIEPFSKGKLTLINSGYFSNGAGYPAGTEGTAYTPGQLKFLTGNAPDGSPAYDSTRGLYFAIRNTDLTDATPFQPGGTLNWAQTLFAGKLNTDGSFAVQPYIDRSSTAALITAAGFTPAYKDCGVNPTTC